MNKELVQQQFGQHAEKYATSQVHAKGDSLARVVERVQPQSTWQALDVATAAGHMALALAPHVAHVVASDLIPEMLTVAKKLAQEREVENISFEEANAEALPFGANSFDLVTSRIAPHHFPHIDRFVRGAARVLKPGGILAAVDNVAPDANTSQGSDAELIEAAAYYNRFEKLRDPSHARALSLAEWIAEFQAAGLTVLHHEIMTKQMEFEPWVKRLGADESTQAEVRAMLVDPPLAAKAYLKPEMRGELLWFTIAEAIIVGRMGSDV